MKFIRNSRYQHYTEAMWEIENNPDVLALDKDPKAEEFLCDIYETENPNLKVPEFSGTDPSLEKAADVENPEIHDVEGIMNLEECEWNEIFTIEEQEIKNHASVPGDNVTNNGASVDRNRTSRETKSTKSKILISKSPVSSSPIYSRQLYLAALNSNCKVVVEKISIDSINYIIEKFSSTRPKPDSSITTKATVKRNHENVIENKTKKAKSSTEPEKIDKKSQYLIEQRRLFNLTKTPMSTINKNSVSRIIDAITIDSDDNQSCIIVNPTKTKPDNLDGTKIPVKSKSKLLKSQKSSIEPPDKMTDKIPVGTISVNRSMSKIKHVKIKIDKKKDKKDWVDKNLKENPVTYENFFNNKKLSILGSGFKISKKPTATASDKPEIDPTDEQWSDLKKPIDDAGNPPCAFDNNNDDDDDDCLWPKEKDQYDNTKHAKKNHDVDDSDEFNWSKEKTQEATDKDRLSHSVSNAHVNDDGGGDDDDDYEWPKEKQGYDEYNANSIEPAESALDTKTFKVETKDTSPIVANDIDCEDESNQKWYGGGDGDSDEEATRVSKSNDPWSKIISKSIKPEFLDEYCGSHANDVIELDDESEYGPSLKGIVKNESFNAPPKKSYGNVWSRIQEFQNQFDSGETVAALPFSAEDMVLDSVDETLKNMNYIKDAKWLNSRNEDFLDSYTENIDDSHMKQHGKWYDVDDDDDIGPTHRRSPPQVISLMDIDLNRKKSVDFISIDPFPGTVAESWVDSGPFKTYKSSFNATSANNNVSSNNSRSHGRPSNKTSRANFVSPNSKLPSFQNMTLEQLFPPFKKEYFKNTTNNFESSPEQLPNWHDTAASSNHLMKSQYSHMPSAYFNGPLAGGPSARDSTKYSRPKLNPRGPSFPCYDLNGSSANYHKDAPTNGFSAVGDSYSIYGSKFSKMGGYPFYPARTGMVPVTPDSPDQHIDPNHLDQQSLDKSKSMSAKFSAVAEKANGSFDSSANRQYNLPTDGSHCTQPPYQDINPAYFYPYMAPPFTQPYGNPNQYYPFFSPFGPVSFTPDSPDPEEMCPQEPPNQIG